MTCQEITNYLHKLALCKADFDEAFHEPNVQECYQTKEKINHLFSVELAEFLMTEKEAREIMGEDFIGVMEVEDALNIQIDRRKVPRIPFSREELERAKELGHFLIYRTDSFSVRDLEELENMQLFNSNLVLNEYRSCDFFTDEKPQLGWSLVSKAPINQRGNYFEQAIGSILYLKKEMYQNAAIPDAYEKAIDEFESTSILTGTSGIRDEKVARKLASLKITQSLRPSVVEAVYDLLVYYKTIGQSLYTQSSLFTKNIRLSDVLTCYFITLGSDMEGKLNINGVTAAGNSKVGFSFCQRIGKFSKRN